jgi:hypothetical protein
MVSLKRSRRFRWTTLTRNSAALVILRLFDECSRPVYYIRQKEKAAGLLLLFPKEEARCSAPLLLFAET